jgi:protein phosphatase
MRRLHANHQESKALRLSREAPLTHPAIEAAAHSHPGRQRRNNEDAFGVHLDLGLFVVADGMGGHAGGEVASRLAVTAVAEHLQRAARRHANAADRSAGAVASRAGDLLAAAVRHANDTVLRAARTRIEERDMGTTIACVLARGDRAAVAHVGDSRVYRYRDGHLEMLTDDHSLLAECLRSGYLTKERAGSFPYRHFVTRSLGGDEHVEADVRLIEPLPGDVILICSDGLTGVVDEEQIAAILADEPRLDHAARLLVDRANEAGGPDNVTVVLVRWPAEA